MYAVKIHVNPIKMRIETANSDIIRPNRVLHFRMDFCFALVSLTIANHYEAAAKQQYHLNKIIKCSSTSLQHRAQSPPHTMARKRKGNK